MVYGYIVYFFFSFYARVVMLVMLSMVIMVPPLVVRSPLRKIGIAVMFERPGVALPLQTQLRSWSWSLSVELERLVSSGTLPRDKMDQFSLRGGWKGRGSGVERGRGITSLIVGWFLIATYIWFKMMQAGLWMCIPTILHIFNFASVTINWRYCNGS